MEVVAGIERDTAEDTEADIAEDLFRNYPSSAFFLKYIYRPLACPFVVFNYSISFKEYIQ